MPSFQELKAEFLALGGKTPSLRDYCCSFDGGTEFSFYGSWDPSFLSDLAFSKSQISDNLPALVELGSGKVAELLPRAPRSSIGISFALRLEGLWLLVHANPSGDIPALRVKLDYMGIRCVRRLSEIVEKVLALLGSRFRYERSVVSRLDINITLRDGAWLLAALANRCYKSRVRKLNVVLGDSGAVESATLGRGLNPLQVTCYDKMAELSQTIDEKGPEKALEAKRKLFDIWAAMGVSPSLIRLELRPKAELLKTILGSHCVEVVGEYIPFLISQLLTRWLEVTTAVNDGKHTERLATEPKFTQLADWFRDSFVGELSQPETEVQAPRVNLQRIRNTRNTYCSLFHAYDGIELMEKEQLIAAIIDDVRANADSIYAKYLELYRKRQELETAVFGGLGLAGPVLSRPDIDALNSAPAHYSEFDAFDSGDSVEELLALGDGLAGSAVSSVDNPTGDRPADPAQAVGGSGRASVPAGGQTVPVGETIPRAVPAGGQTVPVGETIPRAVPAGGQTVPVGETIPRAVPAGGQTVPVGETASRVLPPIGDGKAVERLRRFRQGLNVEMVGGAP